MSTGATSLVASGTVTVARADAAARARAGRGTGGGSAVMRRHGVTFLGRRRPGIVTARGGARSSAGARARRGRAASVSRTTVAQVGAERRPGRARGGAVPANSSRVRAASYRRAEEAPVDAALDAPTAAAGTGPPRRGSTRPRRGRSRRSTGLSTSLEQQHQHDVRRHQRGGQRGVDQGALDDQVDVVEPVAQDRDAGRQRDRRSAGDHQRLSERRGHRRRGHSATLTPQHEQDRRRPRRRTSLSCCRSTPRDAAEPEDEGGTPSSTASRAPIQPPSSTSGIAGPGTPDRVRRVRDRRVGERPRLQGGTRRRSAARPSTASHADRTPAAAQRAGRSGRAGTAGAGSRTVPETSPGAEPRRRAAAGQASSVGVAERGGVAVGGSRTRPSSTPAAEEQPADRVAGLPRRHERPPTEISTQRAAGWSAMSQLRRGVRPPARARQLDHDQRARADAGRRRAAAGTGAPSWLGLPQPQRDVRGLHGLADDGAQVGAQRRPGRARGAAARRSRRGCGRRRSGSGRSAGPRRAWMRGAQRPEQGRDRQGRGGHGQVGVAGDRAQHEPGAPAPSTRYVATSSDGQRPCRPGCG